MMLMLKKVEVWEPWGGISKQEGFHLCVADGWVSLMNEAARLSRDVKPELRELLYANSPLRADDGYAWFELDDGRLAALELSVLEENPVRDAGELHRFFR